MAKIYLDYAATAPIRPEINKLVKSLLSQKFGNPSSIHSFGREVRELIDNARENLAKFLNCTSQEIIFTSGGTEANNLAIKGVVSGFKDKIDLPHIITTKIEHHSVLHVCQSLEKSRKTEVTYLDVDKNGLIDSSEVKKAIKPNTILISIMYANNEVGTIEPIRQIGKMIEKLNRRREQIIYFHTDAIQAGHYLKCDTKYLHVDLLTISGHKLGSLKGAGALFVKKNTPLAPQIIGGAHEYNLRAGTENTLGIITLGEAVKFANNIKEVKKIQKLRNYLEKKILKDIPSVEPNGHLIKRLPNITNLNFKYVEGESILLNLDLKGIAVSTGSACTSGSLEPSHVIMAMHECPKRAHGSIRFSLGWKTTKKNIDYVIKTLPKIIKRLRKISPFGKKEY